MSSCSSLLHLKVTKIVSSSDGLCRHTIVNVWRTEHIMGFYVKLRCSGNPAVI